MWSVIGVTVLGSLPRLINFVGGHAKDNEKMTLATVVVGGGGALSPDIQAILYQVLNYLAELVKPAAA